MTRRDGMSVLVSLLLQLGAGVWSGGDAVQGQFL
jgi:hypothetical protein